MKISALFGLLLSLLLLSTMLSANESASAGPVEITADRAERDEAAGTLIYLGNVIITRDQLIVHAASLIITELEDGNKIATLKGSPLTFENTDAEGRLMTGSALEADYDMNTEILILRREAVIEQLGDTISSERIDIDNKNNFATAGGAGQRVHSILKSKDNQ